MSGPAACFFLKHSRHRPLVTSAARPLVLFGAVAHQRPGRLFRAPARHRQSTFAHLLQQLVLHRCLAKCSDERGVQGLKDQAWCREVRNLNGHVLHPLSCPSGTAAQFSPSILYFYTAAQRPQRCEVHNHVNSHRVFKATLYSRCYRLRHSRLRVFIVWSRRRQIALQLFSRLGRTM